MVHSTWEAAHTATSIQSYGGARWCPGSVRLAKLHDVLQAAMGWTNSHLHSFRVGGTRYGMQFDDYPDDEIDEKSVTVIGVLRGQRQLVHEYDLGDSWEHDVVIEAMTTTVLGLKFAVCVDGQNALPARGLWWRRRLCDDAQGALRSVTRGASGLPRVARWPV